MTAGGVTMAEAAEALRQILGGPTECGDCLEIRTFGQRLVRKVPGPLCNHRAPDPPRSPDVFELIVGIPIDEWIAARTPERLAELIHIRDYGYEKRYRLGNGRTTVTDEVGRVLRVESDTP